MITDYIPPSNVFNTEVYIFAPTDLVVGDLFGTSNVPLKQLAENTAYLQRFKGMLYHGNGVPGLTVIPSGAVLDAYSLGNILYVDEDTGAYYKLTSITPVTWENISAAAVMNVAGLKLNLSGDDSNYLQLSYNSSNGALELKDKNGNFANVKVGLVYYNSIEGTSLSSIETTKVVDSEILLLANIDNASENADAAFTVKRLIDIPEMIITSFYRKNLTYSDDTWYVSLPTGEVISNHFVEGDFVQINDVPEDTGEEINGFYRIVYVNDALGYFRTSADFWSAVALEDKIGISATISKDNSAMINWNNTLSSWEFKTRDGSLVSLRIAGFVNEAGVTLNFLADRVISTQIQFDEIFANVDSGESVCYLRKPETLYVDIIEDEYIFIKPNSDLGSNGAYTLNNVAEIIGSNVKIEMAPGAKITLGASGAIRIKDHTNLTPDVNTPYTTSGFQLLSEDCYENSESETPNQAIQIAVNDPVFLFSETLGITGRRTVSAVSKHSHEYFNSGVDKAAIDTSIDFDVISDSDSTYIAYVSGSNIYVKKYTYNPSTKVLDLTSTIASSTDSGNYTHPRIVVDDTYVYVFFAQGGTSLRAVRFGKTTSGGSISTATTNVVSANQYDYPHVALGGDGYAYVISADTAEYTPGHVSLFKFNLSTMVTDSSSLNFASYGDLGGYDIINADSTYVIAVARDSDTISTARVYRIAKSNLAITEASYGYAADSGITSASIVALQAGGTYAFGCALTVIGGDTIFFRFDSTCSIFSSETTLFTGDEIARAYVNRSNVFVSSSTDIITVTKNIDGVTGSDRKLAIAESLNEGSTWTNSELDLTDDASDLIAIPAYSTNDHLFVFVYDSLVTSILRVHYSIDVTITPTIATLGLTDIKVSFDFLEHLNLDLNFDAGLYSGDYVLRIKNLVNSKVYTYVENGIRTSFIDGSKRTFGINITIDGDPLNAFGNVIYQTYHSNFMACSLFGPNETGYTIINDCVNCNFIGHFNGSATVINGDINE